ncbi:MAG: TonB-dependent receptor, partial [Acidobacteria bacterium]|nr:TonB-dependent receptor [Acidobacteriota bacterium]
PSNTATSTPTPATTSPGTSPPTTTTPPTVATNPQPTPTPGVPTPGGTPQPTAASTDVRAGVNAKDSRRGGAFTEVEVLSLPLGGTTLTRTFDELALYLPDVFLPPQTIGGGSGPGVGAGVGTSGQFSVNGLRSRANNFTVDGSDNNDEDIGVRRQGFFALVPQPIESIKEYQVITLLAPAQFGRNFGAQVNAISRSGGSGMHGALYGIFNSSRLNARNFFDTGDGGDGVFALRSGTQPVIVTPSVAFNPSTLNFDAVGGRALTVRDGRGGSDSFTLGQGGLVLGGPLVPGKLFYFVSAEGQLLNATRESSFVVPTVAQRGVFSTGASGLFFDPFTNEPEFAFPTTFGGDAVFSLYPFPNNPSGIYGANTYTRELPAGAQGKILSGKFDGNFDLAGRAQSVTGRYNFTDDWRDIPVTGGALFSSLRPRVRTQNFSFFFNSEISAPSSGTLVFNQVRLSYGRTRLNFDEARDREFLIQSDDFPDTPFLLNAPVLENLTLPNFDAPNNRLVANSGPVIYRTGVGTVEDRIGPLGQVIIAGFSPVGVDVFNFPQKRVNNTYQFADQLTVKSGDHNFAFGTDNRRTELNSVLPRNFRPLLSFNGAPRLGLDTTGLVITNNFVEPSTLAAASAASGFFQTLTTGSDAGVNLRFYQLNFYAQDEWRIRPNLTLSLGLRYENNTPVREVNNRIESTFNDPSIAALVPGLNVFLAGRTSIYDPDLNNFSPRLGVAYAPHWFGEPGATRLRAGYGHFNDQILGAVVSQSRNVFPTFVTVNTAGGFGNLLFPFAPLSLLNPSDPNLGLVVPGTLNRLAGSSLAQRIATI